jgi:hypothetical protein
MAHKPEKTPIESIYRCMPAAWQRGLLNALVGRPGFFEGFLIDDQEDRHVVVYLVNINNLMSLHAHLSELLAPIEEQLSPEKPPRKPKSGS